MSNENTKPATVAAPAPDPRDAKIVALAAQVKELQDENRNLANSVERKVGELEQLAKATPTGDYVVLKGKTYAVERTVEAKFASDEWRKGYIDTDEELVVLKRP